MKGHQPSNIEAPSPKSLAKDRIPSGVPRLWKNDANELTQKRYKMPTSTCSNKQYDAKMKGSSENRAA